MIIAQRERAILRFAEEDDMPRIDELTIICYRAIFESWVETLTKEVYDGIYRNPELTWEESKTRQNHTLFSEHPEWVWVLEKDKQVIGYVTFRLRPERNYGVIENNAVDPAYAGRGLGRFMYQHVLQYFRNQGLRFAHVETGLDSPHLAARKAYEAVGFDGMAPIALYWQDLTKKNPGSTPD